MAIDRRKFIQLLGTGAFAATLPRSISRALEIPARRGSGSIQDVEHIVILMQENRSFDHYFGTLRGVRGFGDPRAVKLPSGAPVWNQPHGERVVAPFHPTAPDLGLTFLEDLPHGWADTQEAWNNGKYDRWVPAKGTTSMAYLTRDDIPFHYALADAFTICDAYHCSFMGATDPNRYHMWTGWVGNDGKNGGPVLDNSEAGYDWTTFPERLEKAGVSWKIYQDIGAGLDAEHAWGWGEDAYIGNYGDNSLLYFHAYQNAQPGSPLYQNARTGTNISASGTLFDDFKQDAAANELPQVSWIVAPEAFTEHPNWPANYGAWYISQILDALTANPEVWSKTVLFLNYDENDGFFDHVVPPTPPMSRAQGQSTIDTSHEIFAGNDKYTSGPYGLGVRVPMLVISPWSKGGWVNSEVFDHTSLIRFIERRHPGLHEPNITRWRRAVTGDLTSTLDFRSPSPGKVKLPGTSAYVPTDSMRHEDYKPTPPSEVSLPAQEPGLRPARAVPYDLAVVSNVDAFSKRLTLKFSNAGKSAAVFQVRSGDGSSGPWTYTVGASESVSDAWDLSQGAYDLTVYGPNGFMRAYKGTLGRKENANLSVNVQFDRDGSRIRLNVRNEGGAADVTVQEAYTNKYVSRQLKASDRMNAQFDLGDSYGWYDCTIKVAEDSSFTQRLAGHAECGHDSMSDPLLGKPSDS